MKKIFIIVLLSCSFNSSANKIADAYKALSIFDYFKAKNLFYKSLKSNTAKASYGLATMYFRADNPFTNIDSAAKYINLSLHSAKDTISYFGFRADSLNVASLSEKISLTGFDIYNKLYTVNALNTFLNLFEFSHSDIKNLAYGFRDELAYTPYLISNKSDSISLFLSRYPETHLYQNVKLDFYNFEFKEQVIEIDSLKKVKQLKYFLKHFTQNPNSAIAEKELFILTKNYHQADSVNDFIVNFSTVVTKEEAWKTLYSLSVKSYNKTELSNFISKYPNYPNNETLLNDIKLSEQFLIPLKNRDDLFGYIDTLGIWKIKPQFDDAFDFSEGFAAVCKNDTCFYINKDGKKVSDFYFKETESYKNGVAIVKKDQLFYIINRSGQLISNGFEDMNEMSENVFVCKKNNLYGAINTKGETVIPLVYTKLGNFKNGFAYYLSSQYGLVNSTNKALIAQWDWISDVDSNYIAIVKKGNQFGLMLTNEQIILPTIYDFITPCANGIYLIVKNNLYGFYNLKERCFATSIDFNYNSAYDVNYYTNGKYFKLLKNNEVALIDANGRYSINFGTYSNLFFAKCDVIRIQKNNKYGFIDRKLKTVIPVEFDKASDFENDLAIVTKGEYAMLINKTGVVIFKIKLGGIKKLNDKVYLTSLSTAFGLIDSKGVSLLNMEFTSIDEIYTNLYKCKKITGEIVLFNANTKILNVL